MNDMELVRRVVRYLRLADLVARELGTSVDPDRRIEIAGLLQLEETGANMVVETKEISFSEGRGSGG
jgi:hypothetical protein